MLVQIGWLVDVWFSVRKEEGILLPERPDNLILRYHYSSKKERSKPDI